MDRPVQLFLTLCTALAATAARAAQEPEPKHERLISARTAQLIRASLPKYAPAPAAEPGAAAAAPAAHDADRPANGIVRLPDYIVREPRLPTAEQVMTRRALEQYAMKKYLGPEDGFDRGFLNLFTFAQLWQKIPLLGQLLACPIPSMTNEQRAMVLYEEDERLRKMKDLMEMAAWPTRDGDRASNDKLKREVQKAFMRD